jgi:hypothetical protein
MPTVPLCWSAICPLQGREKSGALYHAAQVFFIRDGIQFPDLVHSLRPNPKNHIQEGWRILDYLAHFPESCHIVRHSPFCAFVFTGLEHCKSFAFLCCSAFHEVPLNDRHCEYPKETWCTPMHVFRDDQCGN